jgi:hypothetical protein
MKLICPHCGLKGTADDALLEKKVRCPQCQKVFRLHETSTVSAMTAPHDAAAYSGEMDKNSEVERAQPTAVEIPASQVVMQPGSVAVSEVGICSVCGFSLSRTYLEEKDEKLFCRICLPA